MQTDLKLDVSKEEFFDFLSASIIGDIKQSTGEELLKEDIAENYTYEKNIKNKMGRAGDVKVTIVDFKPFEKYRAKFTSFQGDNIIAYEIEELKDDQIHVTYSEDYIAADKMKALNFKLVNSLYKKRALSKSETILKNIESYIVNNRRGMER
nr:DUF3284 domain-containing protein [Tissierella sp.]